MAFRKRTKTPSPVGGKADYQLSGDGVRGRLMLRLGVRNVLVMVRVNMIKRAEIVCLTMVEIILSVQRAVIISQCNVSNFGLSMCAYERACVTLFMVCVGLLQART